MERSPLGTKSLPAGEHVSVARSLARRCCPGNVKTACCAGRAFEGGKHVVAGPVDPSMFCYQGFIELRLADRVIYSIVIRRAHISLHLFCAFWCLCRWRWPEPTTRADLFDGLEVGAFGAAVGLCCVHEGPGRRRCQPNPRPPSSYRRKWKICLGCDHSSVIASESGSYPSCRIIKKE